MPFAEIYVFSSQLIRSYNVVAFSHSSCSKRPFNPTNLHCKEALEFRILLLVTALILRGLLSVPSNRHSAPSESKRHFQRLHFAHIKPCAIYSFVMYMVFFYLTLHTGYFTYT